MTVVIVSGGEPLPRHLAGEMPDDAYLIAADSGLDTLISWGFDADIVVGDLDSVGEAALRITQAEMDEHPADKDATDLELALGHACTLEPERIVVLGGQGGRLDHLLANAWLLCDDRWAGFEIEWVSTRGRARVIRLGATLHGATGSLLTLLAVDGPARGVTTDGLRWELERATIEMGSTRGVSNLFLRPVATVRLESGTLLAIQPDPS